ncbi:urease accessory protein UreD [Hymenobacter lutimineralis]|uniref:Urease accessory protein UreD n=1 Tax=Hymenobacter lutimineralis TaxID=2606448 RepID=A0A5D6V3D8_9BACT|nr:urease accessory protein UreD [Hymenobacter lutimineralis]TYZ10066.1 urease accessory protein UreD [Hymenobacter lutimineralis]
MSDSSLWSEVEVTAVRGQSVLTVRRNVQPLKLLSPRTAAGSCHVVLSSYGGGLLAGDVIRLRVAVQPGARLLLSTQANTRVYRSDDGAVAEQLTEAHVAAGALAVVLPDPIVLQAQSRYRQHQHWHLAAGALLLLADWFHSGRIDSGEQFAFTGYESELRISQEERLTVLDRFAFRPEEHIATSPAHFRQHQTSLAVYLAGSPHDARYQQLAAVLQAQQTQTRAGLPVDVSAHDCVVALTQARPGVLLLRALGTSRTALQPIYDQLYQALASTELLAFAAGLRKY